MLEHWGECVILPSCSTTSTLFLSPEHTNPHARALIWLDQSVQGHGEHSWRSWYNWSLEGLTGRVPFILHFCHAHTLQLFFSYKFPLDKIAFCGGYRDGMGEKEKRGQSYPGDEISTLGEYSGRNSSTLFKYSRMLYLRGYSFCICISVLFKCMTVTINNFFP